MQSYLTAWCLLSVLVSSELPEYTQDIQESDQYTQDAVNCDVETGGSCAQGTSISLLQNMLEVKRSKHHALDQLQKADVPLRSAPNVLFIVADDLLPRISSLQAQKDAYMHTPNLDAFIKESLVLTNSHAQQAICTPSRASVLFGRRPDTMHVWGDDEVREECIGCATIPGLFKEAGYYTVGLGKVFGELSETESIQDPQSWSDPAFAGDNWFFGNEDGCGTKEGEKKEGELFTYYNSWKSVDETAVGQCQDSEVRDRAVIWLRNLSSFPDRTEKPWFLAVGFRKPHLPFFAPQKFFDLYNINSTKLADNPFPPWDMPPIAYPRNELGRYLDVAETGFTGQINETLVDWKAKELVHAYQACVSYFDYNVGILLNELKALGHWNSTIIALWSDHGLKLGEHGAWGKSTNFHVDTTAPIILRVPGLTDSGFLSQALVEHVDIMATLLDAAGLDPLPICPEREPWLTNYCTEGHSFLRLAIDPTLNGKNASYSQFERNDLTYMGYSMHTHTGLNFIAWVDFDPESKSTNWTMYGKDCAFELYDHNADPDENYNLANKNEHQARVQELFTQLKLGWRASAKAL